MSIPARFEDGVFKPLLPVALREGTVVDIEVPGEEPAREGRTLRVEDEIFGLWRDRTDIEDSVAYIEDLRSRPRW